MDNKEYLKMMGNKIKQIRLSKKLRQKDLGEMCKMDYTSIGRIENGQKNSYLLTLKNLADKLGCDVKDFL